MGVSDEIKQLYKATNDSTVCKNYIMNIDGTNYDNKNIVLGTFNITEKLCSSSQLKFGECNASMLKVKLVASIGDISKKKITVAQTINDNSIDIGVFNVDSCVLTENKEYRDVVAYDNMFLFNTEVSSWYNDLEFPTTQRDMLISLCGYVGVELADVSLITGNIEIEKTISPEDLKAITVLKCIAELNAGFFRAAADGKIEFVTLNTEDIDDHLEVRHYKTLKTENYATDKITRLTIRTDEDDIGASSGDGDNAYVIEDNFLLYGSSSEKLKGIADIIYEAVKDISYVPYTAEQIGLPYLRCGSRISYKLVSGDTFEGLMLQRTLSGTQGLKDAIKTLGTKRTDEVFGIEKDVIRLKNKTNRLKRTVEQTILAIENLVEGLSSEIKQTADELNVVVKKVANMGDMGVTAIVIMYAVSDSATEGPSETAIWSIEAPKWVNGKYIWQKTVTTYNDGNVYESNAVCITGATGEAGKDGVTIVNVISQYYVSTSKDELKDGSWSSTLPNWVKGKYVWTRSKITYSNSTVGYTTAVCDTSWEVANSIEAKLELKVNTKDLISELNASADVIKLLSNRLIIESSYFKLGADGKATFTGGQIGSFDISDKLSVSVQAYVPPGQAEYDRVRNYILGQGSLSMSEAKYLDLNNSGTITQQDMLLIKKIILGTQSYSACANAVKSTVTAQIDPTNPNALVHLAATTPWGAKKETWIGVAELFTSCVRANVVSGDVVQTTAGVDLDTLNSNLTTYKKESNDLRHLGTFTATTTAKTATINSISGYKTLVFIPYDNTLNLDSIFIPVLAFKTGLQVSLNAYALSNYHGVVSVTYVSDTSIRYGIREVTGWSSINFRVYGMV